MAKRKQTVTAKGILDLDNDTITETLKDEGEVVHKLHTLLEPFDGLGNVSINISYDTEIIPKE